MDWGVVGFVAFLIALVLYPIYLLLLAKGVRSLSDIRDMLTRPPGDRGPRSHRDRHGAEDPDWPIGR